MIELQSVKSVLVVGADNKVALKSITAGDRHEQYFVVNDGLQGGERVIVEGQLKVRPGMTVTPTLQVVPVAGAPRSALPGQEKGP